MTTNGKPPGHTDRVRELAAYIADEPDDEITAEHLIEAVKAGAAVATGAHQAVKGNEEVTKTDHGRPQQDSLPERAADAVGDVVQKVDTWQRVAALALLVALAAFAAWLRWGR